ncbi:nucleoside phosphorylase-I family protein [Clostridium felsineum]|uniref:Uncharacterized protein n=1 Tax=Clostridium felsineum TaxID=36839 RepID=A0A1S8KXB3_9CLOT|nr:hypothetical protein [Clostridium felsineum]URZ07980.1 hypothetical protein CLROS_033460 [Clostridium felsineum]URZ13011.1 hypothetical protein CROST_037610 [Clostridium felsineum]
MVYFLCSFYKEAEEIILYYNLKKEFSYSSFQIFCNEYIKLIISGIGKINAACAIGYIGRETVKNSEDIIINIGICGGRSRNIGEGILVNKIIDVDTKREFYPDIILKHEFEEGTLQTFTTPVVDGNVKDICDMEGSAFFECASKFFENHQIAIIKVVSDKADGSKVELKCLGELIKKNMSKVNSYIKNYENVFYKEKFLSDVCIRNMEKLVRVLRLTESQKIEIKRAMVAYKIRNNKEFDFSGFLKLEVKIKNDGKKYFSKLINDMWA